MVSVLKVVAAQKPTLTVPPPGPAAPRAAPARRYGCCASLGQVTPRPAQPCLTPDLWRCLQIEAAPNHRSRSDFTVNTIGQGNTTDPTGSDLESVDRGTLQTPLSLHYVQS